MNAGIDKLILTTREYTVKDLAVFGQNRTIPQGKKESDLPVIYVPSGIGNGYQVQANGLFYNVNDLCVTSINKTGIQVILNPSKIFHPYELSDTDKTKQAVSIVQKKLSDAGIILDYDTAVISRMDLAKQKFMDRDTRTYIPALSFLKGKKMKGVQYEMGYRWGNNTHENTMYDKSIESNLPTPNLLRNEVKFKNTKFTQRTTGIHSLNELYRAGTPYLTQVYNEYLSKKLFTSQVSNQMVLDFDNEVEILKTIRETNHRNAVLKWLSIRGLEVFMSQGGSMSSIHSIMEQAGFTRKHRHTTEKTILELLSYSNKEIDVKTLIEELRQTFAA